MKRRVFTITFTAIAFALHMFGLTVVIPFVGFVWIAVLERYLHEMADQYHDKYGELNRLTIEALEIFKQNEVLEKHADALREALHKMVDRNNDLDRSYNSILRENTRLKAEAKLNGNRKKEKPREEFRGTLTVVQ